MGKNVKKKPATATGNATAPAFCIQNVEGDICRKHLATEQICRKYQKTEDELHALISKAYHSSEPRVREIKRALERNDKQYALYMISKGRKEEAQPVQANITVKEKSPLEKQQDAVAMANKEVTSDAQALNDAEKELEKAKEDTAKAKEGLEQAKKVLRDAEDRERMAKSKKHSAEEALRASRAIYEQQLVVLNEMSAKKLIHISAIKGGLPSGKLYMSEYDYAKLSAADKEKVIPVSTEDSTFASYPIDFHMYPVKLGMESYQSACHYALAYVKLILEAAEDVKVELVCNDKMVKDLAAMQAA